MTDDVPSNLEAERALIGSVLISPYNTLREARWIIHASDFYKPSHQLLWAAITDLHKHGEPVDVVTVAGKVGEAVPDAWDLLWGMWNDTPASSRWKHYVDLIMRASASRRLINMTAEASQTAFTADPYELAAGLGSDLQRVAHRAGTVPETLTTTTEFAERADTVMPAWIVPGWMRYGWRTIVVATEGGGKSVLTLQWAMQVSQGINPMWPTGPRHTPVNTLVIDLENPEGELRDRIRRMKKILAVKADPPAETECHIWHQPAGIDLRSVSDARDMDAVLTETKPALVVISPLYKAFRREKRENDEDVANDVTTLLDDLRARHKFALVIEHHAPKGSQGNREMGPFGSSIWQRWPEFGISLVKANDAGTIAKFGRFRGDRINTGGWPTSIAWGQTWPWEATYDEGSPWT